MMYAIYMVTTGKLSHTSNPIETEPKMKSITIIAIIAITTAFMFNTMNDIVDVSTKNMEIHFTNLECSTDMECELLTNTAY